MPGGGCQTAAEAEALGAAIRSVDGIGGRGRRRPDVAGFASCRDPMKSGRGSDAALLKRGFPEIAGSERGARAYRLTPGRPLGKNEIPKGGLDSPATSTPTAAVGGRVPPPPSCGEVGQSSFLPFMR